MKKLLTVVLLLTASFTMYAQNLQIKGVVISEADKEPLMGVNVVQKGTTNGTMTDLDGQFTLSVPKGSTIAVSYIGFKAKEFVVNESSTTMNIALAEDVELLSEVVVVGYGVQKKSVVTAAISKVTTEELKSARPSRIEDVLKGKVTGVQVTQNSGQPGSESQIKIRGVGTINDSNPLYIVDGMPVGGGIDYLNPTDIQSIEILKDAASAAIYGTRGANGVILVTTKNGSKGKATINYDMTYGWQNPWKKKEVLNATEYMTIMNEALINDGNAPRYTQQEIAVAGVGTDWQDETFNYNAPVVNHQLSVNGGTEKAQYFLSLGYFNQEGIVGGDYGRSNYDRWTIRSNTSYDVFEALDRSFLNKVKAGLNISYSRTKKTSVTTNSEYGSILGSALSFNPMIPVYADEATAAQILNQYPHAVKDKDGRVFSLPPAGFQELTNPIAQLNRPSLSRDNSDKFVGSFWAELDIMPGLKFKSSYGFDLAFWGSDGYGFPSYLGSMNNSTQSNVSSSMNRGYTWLVENVLTYNKTFLDNHNVTVVLGQSGQKYRVRALSGNDYDLLETDPSKANINSAIADRSLERVSGGTNGFTFESLASYFGRIDYNFNEKYMIQATVRRDGSSRFGSNNKWAIFPAVSVGWNVLNEEFLADMKPEWFDAFKLRFSWGKNGNERIGNFRYTSLMDGGQNYYFGGGYSVATASKNGTMQYGTSPAAIPNPSVKWEESEQVDFGLDMRMFGSKLNFGFDYFKKQTNGMLMNMPIPTYVGQGAPMANVGDMENWGLEFELGWRQSHGDFSYRVAANATFVRNKLINFGNASGIATYQDAGAAGVGSYVRGENGEVWPFFYGYKTDGIFQNQAEVDSYVNSSGAKLQASAQPGDVRFKDISGPDGVPDGIISDFDKTKIGKGAPDWTYGIHLGADYKSFDINFFFQGTLGNDNFDFAQRGDIPAANRPAWILDRWVGEGSSNKIPRMTNANPNGNWKSSDIYLKDGSYLRLKTAQFGYTLPQHLTKIATIQSLRIFVMAENLLTFTKYDGFDPEVADGYTSIGVDKGVYPQSRTISLGANITF
jgi:TonB-linked outer membrane protein, SusC/RagA family